MTKEKLRLSDVDLVRLQKLRLIDDDFMNACFQENEQAVTELLDTFIPGKKLCIESVQTQYVIKNLYGRSAELDIHARDITGKRFNIEVQREGKGAGPKRARYHASLLDASSIKSGEKVEKLPENYVIFITEKDYFGCGRPLYHVSRVVQESGMLFGDGSHILYVNGKYTGDDPVGHLMHDFRCSNPGEMHSDVLRETARYFKETEEGQVKMCKIWDEIRQEGFELGQKRGLQNLINTIKLFSDDFESIYKAVIQNRDYRHLTREEVMEYYQI